MMLRRAITRSIPSSRRSVLMSNGPVVQLVARGMATTQDPRIKVDHPVVELDGDEMTRIIWKKIREEVGLFG